MQYILNSEEMKRYDDNTIHKIGIPSMVLMEKAAMAVVEELEDFDLNNILIVCGSGNNGGDGAAIARILHLQGKKVTILFAGSVEKCTEETRQQLQIAKNCGVRMVVEADWSRYTLVLDAMFGIGLSRDVTGHFAEIIQEMNDSALPIVAVDIPSGISADTGKVLGHAVMAKKTVAFAFKKVGHVLYPGTEYAGEVKVKDIGITEASFFGDYPEIHTYTSSDLSMVPKRKPYSNKGSYGKVLVIGGSSNMNGAAYLSAKSAYRMGAGLVYVYTLENNRDIMQTLLPEAILKTYDIDQVEHIALLELLEKVDVAIVGPGMGITKHTKHLLEMVLVNADVPLIVDADALNIIAEMPELLEKHPQPLIITPHLKEMSRITGEAVSDISQNLIETAQNYAAQENVICVLKDARTVVATGGGHTYINQSGCNAMATGGSGDVLTGAIGGLIAQGAEIDAAARLGVYIHGLAGEKAAQKLGNYAVIASDIADCISEAIMEV